MMPKPQQNSYPFYIPKMKQQENLPIKIADRSFGEIQRNQNNIGFAPGLKAIQPLEPKQLNFGGKQNFSNNSFNGGVMHTYHKNWLDIIQF